MVKNFYSDLKIGVLGGGQLGRMLLQEAINYNITLIFLDPDKTCPCAGLSPVIQGDLKDYDTVYKFGKKVDLLTIEIEHVNVDALFQLEKEGITVYPQPAVLKIIQDKGEQKLFYKENNIPTADFFLVEEKEELQKIKNYPVIQKLRKGGYDGKGVLKFNSVSDLKNSFQGPTIIEDCIDFEKEISVIVARNSSGEIKSYPLVELEFNPQANLVEFLFSPGNVKVAIEKEAERIAVLVADKLKIVGLLAVEMFVTKDGKVLVNEIAPRPHNSGHQTIEGNITSQYEQHLRAIINLPLGSTEIIKPSVMVNLLGEPGYTGEAVYKGIEEVVKIEGTKVHLYGKKNTKPFRKMGHVTVIDNTIEGAKEKGNRVKNILKVISK